MGNSSSKAASKAASGATRRQYPSTSSILNNATSTSNAPSHSQPPSTAPPASVHPSPASQPPSDTRSAHVDLDARDPHFASSLRSIGSVRRTQESTRPSPQAFPTSSQPPPSQGAPRGQNVFPSRSAITNPAIAIVEARQRITKLFEEESENMGRPGFQGKTLISAKEIREAIRLRDGGKSEDDVEKMMRLKRGILSKTLGRGIVGNV